MIVLASSDGLGKERFSDARKGSEIDSGGLWAC